MKSGRWEVGSEFHWDTTYLRNPNSRSTHQFPADHILHGTGRSSIAAIAGALKETRRSLHLPSYFCQEVAQALRPYFNLKQYTDSPTLEIPDVSSIDACSGDVVLAVNYFGLRDGKAWIAWKQRNPGIILIEDHTHDPFSGWVRQSVADYAMASLRKTLPIPDGSLLWSPVGTVLPPAPERQSSGATEKLASMLLKAAYLQGADIPKTVFRELQIAGEAALSRPNTDEAASAFTRSVLDHLDFDQLVSQRRENFKLFSASVNHESVCILQPSNLATATPYNGVVVCQTRQLRDSLRDHLVSSAIYPAVHWKQSHGAQTNEQRLADRILTIPLDFRYSVEDVVRICQVVQTFLNDC